MKFTEVIFNCPDEKSYEVEECLAALNFQNFFIEKKKGAEAELKCYFEIGQALPKVLESLQALDLCIKNETELEEIDWLAAWIETLEPFELTEKVWVNPFPDRNIEAQEGELILNIVPGTAFGTGLHETTQLAARLLNQQDLKGLRVLDVGCGTGVLALLSRLKGASFVTAVDDDPLAIRKSEEIFKRHKVDIELYQSDLLASVDRAKQYDIIVANIICEVLLDMVDQDAWTHFFREDTLALFSGISEKKRALFEERANQLNWTILDSKQEGDWNAYLFKA